MKQSTKSLDLTSLEHVEFDDGSRVAVRSSPDGVHVTGHIRGDWIEARWDHHTAAEQAHLLATGAPDAYWQLPEDRAQQIARAIDGAAGQSSMLPVADSIEDITTRTVPIDGGAAVVEHIDGRAEITVRLGDRIVCGLALSEREADQLGMALARPGGFTVGDYWDMQDQLGTTRAA